MLLLEASEEDLNDSRETFTRAMGCNHLPGFKENLSHLKCHPEKVIELNNTNLKTSHMKINIWQ
jgi:hypothetical protein